MVEAGMTSMESIRSASKNAPQLMRIYNTTGSITSGKMADIIAVNADPTQDIITMLNVVFVMKEGEVYKSEMK
jgi:imidazolonepropionase-like amidohydrolase